MKSMFILSSVSKNTEQISASVSFGAVWFLQGQYVPYFTMITTYKILVENLKWRDNLEDLGVNGRMILRRILKEEAARMWTGFIWLKKGYSSEKAGNLLTS